MKLMMFLGNDLIEAIPLNITQISQPGYVGNLKRILKQKHHDLIQQEPEEPEFLVVDPQPKEHFNF